MSKDKDNKIYSIIIRYARSSIYTKILNLLYAYIKPKLLTPELMGVWSLLTLIISLSKQSHLGAFHPFVILYHQWIMKGR